MSFWVLHFDSNLSSSDDGSRAKKQQKGALSTTGTLLKTSAGKMSFDTTKGRTVISPFSAHAGDVVASNHTMTTLLPTDHTATPLIPDSDDDESDSSFHLETPKPKPKPKPLSGQVVDEGPPPTPLAPPKETAVPTLDDDMIPETPKAKQPKIVLPVSTPKPNTSKKEPSKKELPVMEDDEFADPVPPKAAAHNKTKSSFWDALCCRSTHAVAT